MGVHSPGVLWALASPAASFFLICPHCHLTADLGYTGQTVFTEVVLPRLLQAGPPCTFAKKYCCCCCNASKGMLLQQSMLNGRHCSVRHNCRVDDAGGGDSSWLVKMAGGPTRTKTRRQARAHCCFPPRQRRPR